MILANRTVFFSRIKVMLQLLYGSNSVKLDEYYLAFRKKYTEAEAIENLNPKMIEEKLGTTGFFTNDKLFVLKNIFVNQVRLGKVSTNLDQVLKVLAKFKNQSILFIEEDEKKLKYYQLYFPQIQTKEFKVSQVLFTYLDSFTPGNLKVCFGYWQRLQLSEAPELVFHLLKRRIRELISLQNGELKGNYQPWYLGKLKSQSHKFEFKKLLKIYQSLFNFEVGQKTGTVPLSVEQAIETVMALNL